MFGNRAFCSFHKHCLYSGEVRRPARERAMIKKGKAGVFSYCVLLSKSPIDQLEIVHSEALCDRRYKASPPVVCGVAKSYEGALGLIKALSDRAIEAGFAGDMRGYMLARS